MEIDRDQKKINKETIQIKRHRDTKAKRQRNCQKKWRRNYEKNRQRNFETNRQRNKETKKQGDKETKDKKHYVGGKTQRLKKTRMSKQKKRNRTNSIIT